MCLRGVGGRLGERANERANERASEKARKRERGCARELVSEPVRASGNMWLAAVDTHTFYYFI